MSASSWSKSFRAGDLRAQFRLPSAPDGTELTYLCGHSLGAMPRDAEAMIQQGLTDWAQRAVDGHFEGDKPWFHLVDDLREPMGAIVGAPAQSVVLVGTLTNNLHLLLRSFYRPLGKRTRILMEHSAFPSDRFCVRSHVASRGYDPDQHVLTVRGSGPHGVPTTEEILAAIDAHAEEIATILLPGVSYINGAVYDIRAITQRGQHAGALVGWDLAHAVGNIKLSLDADNVDFAAWCTYKYLNSGPGALGGLFVHDRHTRDGAPPIPRYEGWWGNRSETRFTPNTDFDPAPGAAAWQLSNVPVFSALPLYASLPHFQKIGMSRLSMLGRSAHKQLRSALEDAHPHLEFLTPRDAHGTQLSLVLPGRANAIQRALQAKKIVCDTRGDDILRVGPVPLYNTAQDVEIFIDALDEVLSSSTVSSS